MRMRGGVRPGEVCAAVMAKHTMGWSTYLNAMAFDYDEFVAELDQITAYVREHASDPAPAGAR